MLVALFKDSIVTKVDPEYWRLVALLEDSNVTKVDTEYLRLVALLMTVM